MQYKKDVILGGFESAKMGFSIFGAKSLGRKSVSSTHLLHCRTPSNLFSYSRRLSTFYSLPIRLSANAI